MRNWLVMLFIVISLLFTTGCGDKAPVARGVNGQFSGQNANGISVEVLDIGQGDAILVRTAEQVMLVDTGDVSARDKLVSLLQKKGIRTIDKLVITHPHADHIGGAAAVFEKFEVKQVYDSGVPTTTGLYKQYLTVVQKKKIPFKVLTAGDQVEVGNGAVFQVYSPAREWLEVLKDPKLSKGESSVLNNSSIAGRIVYGNFSMFITGDVEALTEDKMIKLYGDGLKSTVLKSAHHGSNTSSTLAFLKAMSPEIAVISVGANNEYHHPHPSITKRYSANNIKVYRTDLDGTVSIVSDGQAYTITKER